MQCQRCNGKAKLYQVTTKCSDMYSHIHLGTDKEYSGYVPDWIGSGGDYVEFTICRHCGQVQGDWPESRPGDNQYRSGRAS